MTNAEYQARATAIAERLGRQPTHQEIEYGDIIRPDTRPAAERVRQDARVRELTKSDDPWEAEIEKHRAKIRASEDWAEYVRSGYDARRIMDYENLIQSRDDADEQKRILAKHLKTVEPELQPLRELRDSMRWDETRTFSEVNAVEKAIEFGSTPHDPAVFAKMKNDVLTTENTRLDKLETEYNARMMGLQNQIDSLRKARRPVAEPETDGEAESKARLAVKQAAIAAEGAKIAALIESGDFDVANQLMEQRSARQATNG